MIHKAIFYIYKDGKRFGSNASFVYIGEKMYELKLKALKERYPEKEGYSLELIYDRVSRFG